MNENNIPKWQRELRAFLGIKSGIILEGNVYDEFPLFSYGEEISFLGADNLDETVRSLIDDIARSLGTVGVMTDLVREEACGYSLNDAITLDQLKAITENGEIDESAPYWRSVESLFDVYPALTVSDKQANRFKNGNPLDVMRTEIKNAAEDQKIYRVKDRQGNFLSLGIVQDDMIKLYKHF